MKYAGGLASNINEVKAAGCDVSVMTSELTEVTKELAAMKKALDELTKEEEKARSISEPRKRAYYCKDKVVPAMTALRTPADKLEMLVDKNDWPFPTYADLLFEG